MWALHFYRWGPHFNPERKHISLFSLLEAMLQQTLLLASAITETVIMCMLATDARFNRPVPRLFFAASAAFALSSAVLSVLMAMFAVTGRSFAEPQLRQSPVHRWLSGLIVLLMSVHASLGLLYTLGSLLK